MAVQGVKGSGIGQVTDAQIADILRNKYQRPAGDIISDRAGEVTAGAFPMAEQLFGKLPEREYDTKGGAIVGALTDFPAAGQALYDYGIRPALEIPRMVYEGAGQLGGGLGEILAQPTEARMQEIIEEESPALRSQISSDLSSFSEMARGLAQKAPPMVSDADETQEQIDDLTSSISATKAEQTTAPGTDDALENQQAQTEAAGIFGTATTTGQQTGDQQTDDIENPFEKILKQAMDNVAAIRGEEPQGTLEGYKKEFADATGVDISGKVDKSQALMALGLSLMQNKAGRDFNVSNALSALGEAGEKAMPAFAKAKSEAKAAKLAAGKYALGQLSQDEQAKAARLAAAQSTVSDLLGKQQDFFSKLQLQRDQQLADTALKRLEHRNAVIENAAEGVDLYTDKISSTPLFQDAPDVFKMESYIASGNAKGRVPVKLTEQSISSLSSNLPSLEQSLNRSAAELAELKRIVQEEGITVQQQLGSTVNSIVRGFGINIEGNLDPVAKAKIILKRIATQKTPEILGEAGKTISDADRKLVTDIVGDINLIDGADAQKILTKLSSVYDLVVEKGRKNLDTAYGTLTAAGYGGADYGLVPEGYTRAVQAADQAADALDEEEAAELAQLRSGQ